MSSGPASLPHIGLVLGPAAPVANAVGNPGFLPVFALLGGASPAPLAAPVITTTALADIPAGASGVATLSATGGAPITWTLESGTLPGWLSLGAGGTLTYTAASPSYTAFSVRAANVAGFDTQALALTVPNSASGDPLVGATGATVMDASPGVFTLTGSAVQLQYTPGAMSYTLDPIAGTFTLTGIPVETAADERVSPRWQVVVSVQSPGWTSTST